MRKVVQRVAILHDLQAAEKKRRSVAERRGVSLSQTGAGAAALTIEGPDLPLALAWRAIQERAQAMGCLEGDTRSQLQREHDAALEMLTIDADMGVAGGVSARPTTGLEGEPLELVVRGAHVAVVMPYSVAEGGEHELAEIPGLGPILPSAARELLEHADSIRRVAVSAETGEVLAVDDAVPGPDRRRRRQAQDRGPQDSSEEKRGDPDEWPEDWPGHPDVDPDPDPDPSGPFPNGCSQATPSPADDPSKTLVSADTLALLRDLAGRKVIWRDLNTSAYRVPGRLRRFVEYRDRTCCFPGCTVPGRYCDVDHREEWPRGGTHADNCHVLCRRHHRAKQFYFAEVTLDAATGDTCWTTHEGHTYRRPPPRF